jgi:hypothetical protein
MGVLRKLRDSEKFGESYQDTGRRVAQLGSLAAAGAHSPYFCDNAFDTSREVMSTI